MNCSNSPCAVPEQFAAELSVPMCPHALDQGTGWYELCPLLGRAGKCWDHKSPAHCSFAAYSIFTFSTRIILISHVFLLF